MKDGKYAVYEESNGQESVLGRFEIKNGEISFPGEADRLNIDRFPAGPISKHTELLLEHFSNGKNKGVRIEAESTGEPVKKFGENNSV
jgi:hypothetical protein